MSTNTGSSASREGIRKRLLSGRRKSDTWNKSAEACSREHAPEDTGSYQWRTIHGCEIRITSRTSICMLGRNSPTSPCSGERAVVGAWGSGAKRQAILVSPRRSQSSEHGREQRHLEHRTSSFLPQQKRYFVAISTIY